MSLGATITVGGAPDPELGEAESVEVHEQAGETTTFVLRLPVDVAGGDLPLLADDRLGPGSEIAVLVPGGLLPECLVRGPVHAQQVHLRHGGAGSRLEVRGSDASVAMDRETRSAVWTGADSDAVTAIAASYGFLPDVERTSALHTEVKHTLVQRDSDLRFIRRLARRNGCWFWVTSDAVGIQEAHFRRPDLGGAPSASLAINLETPSLESLELSWDVERPTSAEGGQLDLNAKTALDGSAPASPLAPLGAVPLGAVDGETRSIHVSAPADDAGDLRARGEGALIEAGWFVQASCRTSVAAAGAVVRAGTVVELLGAGSRHSGRYLAWSVRHVIDATAHRMEIELRRNGWGS